MINDEESLCEAYFTNNNQQILLTKNHIIILKNYRLLSSGGGGYVEKDSENVIRRSDVELVLGNKDVQQVLIQLHGVSTAPKQVVAIQLTSHLEIEKVQQMLLLVPNMN